MAPTVDAFTVRGKREKRRKRGAVGSRYRRATIDAPLASGWHWRGIDAGAVPRTAACREVGDGANGRGLGVSGREGGEGGAGEAGPS